MAKPFHILVLRFSALGDVAMVVPVLKLLLNQYPHLEVTMVSTAFNKPLFTGIERLNFYPVDFKNEFAGLKGLYQLAQRLRAALQFDAVADLHDVLKTKVIRNLLQKRPIAVINKGRKQKKELTRKKNKKLRPLKPGFKRYADVFASLGFPVELQKAGGLVHLIPRPELVAASHANRKFIGIAPFAKHEAKLYPLQKMEELVGLIASDSHNELFLFGAPAEAALLNHWIKGAPNIQVVAGRFSFEEELNIISQLDVMVSMDSANMHLASLYGVPVVSIWGGTHPFLGFYGWAQDIENAVQLDLPCRPSSVYGNKDCPVHGKAGCMQDITPGMIADRVKIVLAK